MPSKKTGGCRKTATALWCALAGLVFCALCFFPAVSCLSLTNRKRPADRALSRAALQGFSISYTHSVNKGRVHDFYRCDGKTLLLWRTDFVSYGAGIPEAGESPGAVFSVTPEGYSISNMNRRLEKLVLAVGLVAEHSITTTHGERFLKELFAPQTSLIVEVKRVPLLPYLLARHL